MLKIMMSLFGTKSTQSKRRSNALSINVDALEARDLKSALAYPPDPCLVPASAIVSHAPPSDIVSHAPSSDIVMHAPPSDILLHSPPSE